MNEYLDTPIVASKRSYIEPKLDTDGYTKKSGSPTSMMIRLQGEKRWRRVMVWQFSNVGTCFVRINKKDLIVREHLIPEPSK